MRTFLSIGFVLAFLSLTAQSPAPAFPQGWSGVWKGELEIFIEVGRVQTLPMELHILPRQTGLGWTWTIFYGEDRENGKRDYLLQVVDAAKGKFLIDEQNGIRMEGYLLGGKFVQHFEVGGQWLLATTQWVGEDHLLWELFAGDQKPVSVTGGGTHQGEEIQEVKTFPVNVMQRALLKRVSKG